MLRNFLVLSYYNSHKSQVYPIYLRRVLLVMFIALVAFLGAYSITNAQTTTSTTTDWNLYGWCSVSVQERPIGDNDFAIQWDSLITGTQSSTTSYTWSGYAGQNSDNTPNQQFVSTRISQNGNYQSTVTGKSNSKSRAFTCSANVNLNQSSDSPGLAGSCKPQVNGMTVRWWTDEYWYPRASTTYEWTGSDFTSTTTPSFTHTYSTEGTKRAQLRIARDNEELNLSCETYVSSTTGSGCFIATAAFGTELEPEVVTLRKFRDEDLLTNKIGREFVSAYYKVSPPIADYIRERDNLRGAVRLGLRPLIYVAGKLTN